MTEATPERPPGQSARPRWRWPLAIVAGVLILAVIALAAARNVIAERLAQDWLAQRRVPAGFEVQSLSMTGLRAKVRLGPPADPDLTVERLEVAYALAGPWNGQRLGVVTHSIRLWRPHLKAQLSGGRLHLGSLDALLQELARRPPSAAPPPDIIVEEGSLRLATPAGILRLEGDGRSASGVFVAATARIAPFALAASGMRLSGGGSTLSARQTAGRLHATLISSSLAGAGTGLDIHVGPTTLVADLPAPLAGRLAGAARLTLATTALTAASLHARTQNGRLSASFGGGVDVGASAQRLDGRLTAAGEASGVVVAAGQSIDRAAVRLDLARLALAHGPAGVEVDVDGQGSAEADRAQGAGMRLETASAAVRLHAAASQTGAAGWTGQLRATGDLSARAGLGHAAAAQLAQRVPLLGAEPAYRTALARGFEGFRVSAPAWTLLESNRGAQISLAAPLTLQTASGARLTLAGAAVFDRTGAAGQTRLAIAGGGLPSLDADLTRWTAAASGLGADVRLRSRVDASLARGASIEAKGHATLAGGRFRFDLGDCARVAVERFAFDPNPVTDVAAQICAGDAALVEVGPAGWRARGRIEAAHGTAPGFAASILEAGGEFSAEGGAGRLGDVALRLDHSRFVDRTDPVRFRPVAASGRLGFSRGVWIGNFAATTANGHPLATIRVRHDPATGVGRADIDARALAFAPGGLQPADLSPTAQFAKNAQGPAAFTGYFAWGPDGTRSGGELVAHDLRFTSPAGAVLGLDSDLHFTSLSPLVSAEDQSITIREVQGIAPFSGLTAVFDFNANGASLDAASAGYSGGSVRLEAMSIPFASGSVYKGALVFDHVDLGKIIAGSNLADQIKVQAIINARIPFRAGPDGITIAGGELAAVGPGRISIARTALGGAQAAPAGGRAQTNVAQDLAYQAMENLAFDRLDASVNSIAGDRLSMVFHVRGRHDPPKPTRATIALSDLIGGKALKKPIPLPAGTEIDLTLDTTLNFGELVRALEETWRESLGQPPAARSAPVQGAAAPVSTRK